MPVTRPRRPAQDRRRHRAHAESVSPTRVINRTLRAGLERPRPDGSRTRPFVQKTIAMGRPKVDLDKASALAARLEDEESGVQADPPRMKIVGLDILLYAVNPGAPHHDRIVAWWEEALNGDETIGLAWAVVVGFLRLSTNSRIFPNPLFPEQAVDRIDAWLALDIVSFVTETRDQWPMPRGLLTDVGVAGDLVADANLWRRWRRPTVRHWPATSVGCSMMTASTAFCSARGARQEPVPGHPEEVLRGVEALFEGLALHGHRNRPARHPGAGHTMGCRRRTAGDRLL